MKVIVFGATGDTGRQVVDQLLDEGHEVTAVVRQPNQLEMFHERLCVLQGDVLNSSSIYNPMVGKDAVLSALGVRHRKPTKVYSEGTDNIMKAMKKCEIHRLICLSAAPLELPQDIPFMERMFLQVFLKRFLKNIYEDMERMEQKVRQSGLDWTIIRPPNLTNGPRTSNYRISINQPITKAKMLKGISRADLAECMVTQLNHPASIHGIIDISY